MHFELAHNSIQKNSNWYILLLCCWSPMIGHRHRRTGAHLRRLDFLNINSGVSDAHYSLPMVYKRKVTRHVKRGCSATWQAPLTPSERKKWDWNDLASNMLCRGRRCSDVAGLEKTLPQRKAWAGWNGNSTMQWRERDSGTHEDHGRNAIRFHADPVKTSSLRVRWGKWYCEQLQRWEEGSWCALASRLHEPS